MSGTATTIVNETASQLTLRGRDGRTLTLAPLQALLVDDPSSFDFKELKRKGLVRVREEAPTAQVEQLLTIAWTTGVGIAVVAANLADGEPLFGMTDIWHPLVWGLGIALWILVVVVVTAWTTGSLTLVIRGAGQVVAFLIVITIGLGLPAAVIYVFGGGRSLILDGNNSLALFGRLIQLAFITTTSLLPGLLFFLFDRYALGTLRKQLYVNLFRLDQNVGTVSQIHAKYGSQISETYGSDDEERGRLARGSRWPVLVCAFVFTIGWIVAFLPVGDFAPKNNGDLLRALVPQSTAFTFGFLGAYFFSLRLIAIRYARGDLKPKAYTSIIVRILIVAVLSWVLDAIFTGESSSKLVLAFLFGITPDSFFIWVKKMSSGVVVEEAKLPLTDLEGIDLYDLGRLESEGIVNIEGLAHHELIDLIIETRIPVPRLIDWIDQSILYLHLDKEGRTKLRGYGIRTATDLLRCWDQAELRATGSDRSEFQNFKALLGDAGKPYRLEVIRDALFDDEWLKIVLSWRSDVKRQPIAEDARPAQVVKLESPAGEQAEAKRTAAE